MQGFPNESVIGSALNRHAVQLDLRKFIDVEAELGAVGEATRTDLQADHWQSRSLATKIAFPEHQQKSSTKSWKAWPIW